MLSVVTVDKESSSFHIGKNISRNEVMQIIARNIEESCSSDPNFNGTEYINITFQHRFGRFGTNT